MKIRIRARKIVPPRSFRAALRPQVAHPVRFASTAVKRSIRWALAGMLAARAGGPADCETDPVTPPGTGTGAPPAVLSAQQDHQRMMERLHITALRPGRNGGNPSATNYANYDESRANPFPNLPDPLVLKNGQKVTTPEQWWSQRRPEILEDFEREIYGRTPKATPQVNWQVLQTTTGTNGDIATITKQLVGHVDNSSYPAVTVNIALTLTTPAGATGPVPAIMQFGFNFGAGFPGGTNALGRGFFTGNTVPARTNAPAGFAGSSPARATNAFGRGPFPAGFGGEPAWHHQVLARGWGYAILTPNSVQEDNGGGLTRGIIGLVNQGRPRKLDDWGVLSAWAWGASRALDYFTTDKTVDAKQVGLEGHSRYGKAALVAMALDQRFAIAYVSSSGEGGAKLHRRNWGEIVENVAGTGEYHWMAGNFLQYAGPLTWGDLPVDSHELIALCAPRPVFIGGGATQGDGWIDAKGSFLAATAAGPVYRLLGQKDLGTTEFPPIETALIDGDIGFRQHRQGHTDAPNWPTFLQFAERYLKAPPRTAMKSADSEAR